MKVSLNGEWIELDESRLSAALRLWDYRGKQAVAVNGEFVPRSAYDEVILQEGDEIDVVAPVGGG